MNFVFVLKHIYPHNASFSDVKLHWANRFSNNKRYKALGLSEALSHKQAPDVYAPVFRTFDIADRTVTADFAVLGLRKVLHFIHLDNASSRLSLLEFDHREGQLT